MYKILEPIMVRMPLYSHEEYKKIDLFADVDKFIQIFSNRPSFLKAIAISSPDFYTSVIENEKNVVYSDKYRDSMLKYIFGESVKTLPADEQHFLAEVDVSISPTFYSWVFTYGGKMQILSPESISKEYQKRLTDALKHCT